MIAQTDIDSIFIDGRWRAAAAAGKESEVVITANDTRYGLAAHVCTRDPSRALRVCEALRFGTVGINDINPTSAAAPFGGVKESGLGREDAQEDLLEYLDLQLVGISL